MTLRTTTSPSRTTGSVFDAPTARMQASGGLMMAVNSSMPYMPRLLTVKVLGVLRSSGVSLPSRARVALSLISAPMAAIGRWSASGTVRVISPSSSATATPTLTRPRCTRSPSS